MLINQFLVRLSACHRPGSADHPLSHACRQIHQRIWTDLRGELGGIRGRVGRMNPLTSLLSPSAQGLPPGLGPGDQTCLTLIWNQCLRENLSACFVQITCLPGQLSARVLEKPPGSLPCCGGRVRAGHQARPCTQGLFSVATMKTSL